MKRMKNKREGGKNLVQRKSARCGFSGESGFLRFLSSYVQRLQKQSKAKQKSSFVLFLLQHTLQDDNLLLCLVFFIIIVIR